MLLAPILTGMNGYQEKGGENQIFSPLLYAGN